MPATIAFLRAINVGGHTVKMDTLRQLFRGLGLVQVSTFIASGNILFETDRSDPTGLEGEIEAQLERALGFPVTTFLRTKEEMDEIVNHPVQPPSGFEDETLRIYTAFLKSEPSAEDLERVFRLRGAVDDFVSRGREIYWYCRIRSSESEFSGAVLEKNLRAPATLRNMTTVYKLAALISART